MVEDHISTKKVLSTKKEEEVMQEVETVTTTPIEDDPEDEVDNILRKSQTEEVKTIEPVSPESPVSPEFSLGAKYDQVSIEMEQTPTEERKQDYSLIDKFFGFLDRVAASEDPEQGLNSTLCGYFSKVV